MGGPTSNGSEAIVPGDKSLSSNPINYVERLGNIRKRYTPPLVILQPTYDGYWVPTDEDLEDTMFKAHSTAKPGTYPMYERNQKIRKSGKKLSDSYVHEECQEYLSIEAKKNRPPIDRSLPPLVRGQHTFGYSYIAFAFAATEARAQNFKFKLDDLESVVDVGVDLLAEKARHWVESSMVFMEEVEEWTKMNKRKDTMTANDPEWKEHLMFMVLYERTVARLMIWNEMKYLIGRLRAEGLENDGSKVRAQLAKDTKLRKLWDDLWLCAAEAVNFVSHSLRDAYAINMGAEHVRVVPPKPGQAWPYYDPVEWRMSVEDFVKFMKEDFYAGVMAMYCLTPNNIDGMHFKTYKSLDNIVKKEGQFLVEYVMLQEPERAAKIPPSMQYLMSEKNIAIDLCYTLVAGNGWQSHALSGLEIRKPVRSRIGRQVRLRVLSQVMRYYRKPKRKSDSLFSGLLTGKEPWCDPKKREEIPMPPEIEGMMQWFMKNMTSMVMFEHFEKAWVQLLKHVVRKPISSSSGKIDYFSELTVAKRTRYRRVVDNIPKDEPSSSTSPIGTSFPFSTESRTQSSHSYLKQENLLSQVLDHSSDTSAHIEELDDDEQLTDEPGCDEDEKLSYATKDAPGHNAEPVARHQLNRHEWKLVQKLFAEDENKTGQVKWIELNKMIRRLGFRVELRGGSVVTWIPSLQVGHPINVHRPHPESSFGPVQCKALASRLKRKYGWTIDNFERKMAKPEVEAIDDSLLD